MPLVVSPVEGVSRVAAVVISLAGVVARCRQAVAVGGRVTDNRQEATGAGGQAAIRAVAGNSNPDDPVVTGGVGGRRMVDAWYRVLVPRGKELVYPTPVCLVV